MHSAQVHAMWRVEEKHFNPSMNLGESEFQGKSGILLGDPV